MGERLDEGSITRWVNVLREGGAALPVPEAPAESVEDAVRALWERYFRRMVGLARMKLDGAKARDAAVDGEDIALSAFESFCGAATRGRFPDLFDRDDLWRLLVVITSRKALSESRRRNRQKRGAGLVRNESDAGSIDDEDALLAQAVGTEPTPESAAIVVEEYRRLLDRLDDEALQKVAIWRMEGFTTDEIAEKLGCARRTVARQLALIRTIWRTDDDESS